MRRSVGHVTCGVNIALVDDTTRPAPIALREVGACNPRSLQHIPQPPKVPQPKLWQPRRRFTKVGAPLAGLPGPSSTPHGSLHAPVLSLGRQASLSPTATILFGSEQQRSRRGDQVIACVQPSSNSASMQPASSHKGPSTGAYSASAHLAVPAGHNPGSRASGCRTLPPKK